VLESQAVLIRTPVPIPREAGVDAAPADAHRRRRTGQGQQVHHAARAALGAAAIAKLLPGSEAPTVIPLEGRGDRVAVHAVCRENVFWETLEELKKVGATSVLVLPVEKMLA
jgi:ATP phosphoribosyltransferase